MATTPTVTPNLINETGVFKFVALRPPKTPDPDKTSRHFLRDSRPLADSILGPLASATNPPTRQRTLSFAKGLVNKRRISPDDPVSKDFPDLLRLWRFLRNISPTPQNSARAQVKAFQEQLPSKSTKSGRNMQQTAALWDRLFLCYILKTERTLNLEDLLGGLRTLNVMEALKDADIESSADLQALLSATAMIPPQLAAWLTPLPVHANALKQLPANNDGNAALYRKLVADLVDTHQALESLAAAPVKRKTVDTTTPTKLAGVSGKAADVHVQASRTVFVMDQPAFKQLPTVAKTILADLGMDAQNVDVLAASARLQKQMVNLYQQLASIDDPSIANFITNEARLVPGVVALVGGAKQLAPAASIPFPNVQPRLLIRPLGIGDLKVVKQKLIKYAAGEVAHIENVLKGESKERKFRTLDRTEQTILSSVETVEDTEKDTQTTERFELKKESEKTIQENMSVQAGVTITASYGPVQLGAHGDFAYSTASQDTTKSSANFAREVVDRAVSKIQKKIKDERTTKNLHEVEEINDHALNNVGQPQHITGVYRWVDKHYTAQIYNYGKRLMFEFIVPEPAAFYIYVQHHDPAKTTNLVKPDPVAITHKGLTAANYQVFVAKYAVQGVTPPPPSSKTVSTTFDQSGVDNGKTISKSTKELVVPEGYRGYRVGHSISLVYVPEGDPYFSLQIGDAIAYALIVPLKTGGHPMILNMTGIIAAESSVLPIAVNGYDVNSYSVTVDVDCILQDETFEKWQLETFDKITAAYKAQLAEYEQKAAAAAVQQGVVIQGQNPGINLQVQKTELKKLCISMITGQYFSAFRAMKDQLPNPPEMDFLEAIQDGKFIQFFEQAFEWEQMTYLFYPYFWGKKENWPQISNLYDNDPLFTQFLQAGAARVVLPVSLPYVDAILYYLETGFLWGGGDSPRLDDPLYRSVADELRNQTDDLQNATAEGDPWDVVLPTTLVWLQPGPELPTFP